MNLGGNTDHNAYTSRLFNPNYELIVIAPDLDAARYDSGAKFPSPVTDVFEAKTGRRWVGAVPTSQWSYVMKKIYNRDVRQFTRQKRVASKCKLAYEIYFSNSLANQGYTSLAPGFISNYRFVP